MCFVASLLAVGIGRGQGNATAGLTSQGLFMWNLDGLTRSELRGSRVCWPNLAATKGCRGYLFTFKQNQRTAFQLESKPPPGTSSCYSVGCSMGNFEVLRLGGKFVSCDPSGEWLGVGHGSLQIGDLYCTNAPPPPDARVFVAPGPSGSALLNALTPFGRDIWNLDALVNDTLAPRMPCINDDMGSIFTVRRGGDCGPLAVFETYTYAFLNAFHSSFRLIAQPPGQAVHVKRNAPGIALDRYETFDGHFIFFRMKGKFITCGGGRWLGEGTGGSPDYSLYCAKPVG
jgi:hypothetical protein